MPTTNPIEQTGMSAHESEIAALERKLEEKKQELAARKDVSVADIDPAHEKKILHEVMRERIEEIPKPSASTAQSDDDDSEKLSQIPESAYVPPDAPKKDVANMQRKQQIRSLVEIAMERSIEDAVKAARATTPYLLDELHDTLVDKYYDKLVQLRKITT